MQVNVDCFTSSDELYAILVSAVVELITSDRYYPSLEFPAFSPALTITVHMCRVSI